MTLICNLIIRGNRACFAVPPDTSVHHRCLVRLVGALAERAFPDIREPLPPEELGNGQRPGDAVLTFMVDSDDDLMVASTEPVRGEAMANLIGEALGLEVRG